MQTPGKLSLPLSRPNDGGEYSKLTIRSTKRGSTVPSVLWECLFGQPRVVHWLFMFELLNFTTEYSLVTQQIFNVLMIINESGHDGPPRRSFDEKLKSVLKVHGKTAAEHMAKVFRESGISIPITKPDLGLHWSVEVGKIQPARELSRIGVGYKDKGSLGLPGSEYDPVECPPSRTDPFKVWAKFLQTWKILKSSIT